MIVMGLYSCPDRNLFPYREYGIVYVVGHKPLEDSIPVFVEEDIEDSTRVKLLALLHRNLAHDAPAHLAQVDHLSLLVGFRDSYGVTPAVVGAPARAGAVGTTSVEAARVAFVLLRVGALDGFEREDLMVENAAGKDPSLGYTSSTPSLNATEVSGLRKILFGGEDRELAGATGTEIVRHYPSR
jgi:hypothetical protein